MLPCCPIRRRKSLACHINQSHLWDCQCMVQGLSIYIYRLAPCTENCSQKISKTFSHNNLEDVLLFCTFEPKKCKCAFRVAVSASTLKILCCGYNMATIKKDKKIKDYDTRSCSGMVISLSLRKQGCKSATYAIYPLFYTQKSHCHENYTQYEKLYYLDVACRLSLFFFWWLFKLSFN